MRILHLTLNYPCASFPHAGIFIHRQIKTLVQLGCEVDVVHPIPWVPSLLKSRYPHYARIPEHEIYDGVQVWRPRFFRPPGTWVSSWEGFLCSKGSEKLIHALHRDRRYLVIHSHWEGTAGVLGLQMQKRFGIPHLCTVRSSRVLNLKKLAPRDQVLRRKVLTESTGVLTVNKTIASFLSKEGIRKDARVLPNGVDRSIFYPLPERNFVNKGSRIVFLFVGTLNTQKGVLDLLRAFREVKASGLEPFLEIVGDGPLRREISGLIQAHHLQTHVSLRGFVNPDGLPAIYWRANILVHPSHTEGLSNTVIEAAACGLPEIAYDIPGMNETVLHRKTGILVPHGDVGRLAAQMGWLARSRRMREEYGCAASEHAAQNFDLKESAEQLFSLYQELTGQKGMRRDVECAVGDYVSV